MVAEALAPKTTGQHGPPETLQPYWQYVWGVRYIDDLVLRDRDADQDSETGDLGKTDSGLEERLYAMQDANWNVVALAEGSGAVQERDLYFPFGKPIVLGPTFGGRGTSSYDWEHLYTGRRYDAETGLYHYRHRPYHAELGRFVSRDRIGYGADEYYRETGASLYAYVRNSPLGRADPSGQQSIAGVPSHECPPPTVRLVVPPRILPAPTGPRLPPRAAPQAPKNAPLPVRWIVKETIRGIYGCLPESGYWVAISALYTQATASSPYVPFYGSHPFEHCVWNCLMTASFGVGYAAAESAIKENIDAQICRLGNTINNVCWSLLSDHLRKLFADHCCSAYQLSDMLDNITGQICGKGLGFVPNPLRDRVKAQLMCNACCKSKGITPNTPEGPGTTRPCGPLFKGRWPREYAKWH